MPLALKANGKHRYSEREKKLFKLLPMAPKSIDTQELLNKFFDGGAPLNGRVSMVGSLRSLSQKVVLNKEPFRIAKSERRGPHPMTFWVQTGRPGQ